MRGGHNVKPSIEKKISGTSRKDRDEGRVESIIEPVNTLPAPAHFDKEHQKKWNDTCERLEKNGLLTAADYDSICLYVETWVMAEEAQRDVQKNGTTLWADTPGGKKPVTNPAFRVYRDCSSFLKPLFEQFGFTPRSRMGLKTDKPKQQTSHILEMMKGGTKKKVV